MTPQEEIKDAFYTTGKMIRIKINELCDTNKHLSAKELQDAYDILNKYFDNDFKNPYEKLEIDDDGEKLGSCPVYFKGRRELIMRTVFVKNNKYYVRWYGNFIEVEKNPIDGEFRTVETY